MSDKTKNLIVRTISGVLFVAIVIAAFMRPDTMVLLFAIITGMTMWEYSGLVNKVEGVSINRFISTVAGVYLFLAIMAFCSEIIINKGVFIPYVLTIIYLFISELYNKENNPISTWAYTMLGQMYIALSFAMINVLAFRGTPEGFVQYGYILPLSVFILLWASDSGAYCAGTLLGKHKLFERISPNKSWEGSIGGGILALIVAGIISYFDIKNGNTSGLNVLQWLGLGLVVVVFGTWGDLVESVFKRTLGVKDSGNVMPGHGGMLDRFDSSLIAIPASVVYLYALSLF